MLARRQECSCDTGLDRSKQSGAMAQPSQASGAGWVDARAASRVWLGEAGEIGTTGAGAAAQNTLRIMPQVSPRWEASERAGEAVGGKRERKRSAGQGRDASVGRRARDVGEPEYRRARE